MLSGAASCAAESTVTGSPTGDEEALLQVSAPSTRASGAAKIVSADSAGTKKREADVCAQITYESKNVLPANAEAAGMQPPMIVGTDENIDPKFKEAGFDFTGIWWMRDNPVPEELVSFATATANSSTFPVLMEWFNSRSRLWSWLDDPIGWLLVKFYSVFEPNDPAYVDFTSSTYGEIQTFLTDFPLIWVDNWPFVYINDDEWLRPSNFKPGSLLPQTNYTLTRIVLGDGSPHPTFWPLFLEHTKTRPWSGEGVLGGKKMISMASDNYCLRLCQILLPCAACLPLC